MPAASLAFSAHASEYSALRRRLLPGFDQFYGAVVDALALPGAGRIDRVLDLGAGTGIVSEIVAESFPAARFVLLDGSEAMLDEARDRLGARVDAVHVQDMSAGLPDGPFDAVVSGLAIHHLGDPAKRALFTEIRDVLRLGGTFVNAEQVLGPTPALEVAYQAQWRADCRALGASEAEIEDAAGRRLHDRSADVEAQLRWLREAGFPMADCLYKRWGFATYVGRTAGA